MNEPTALCQEVNTGHSQFEVPDSDSKRILCCYMLICLYLLTGGAGLVTMSTMCLCGTDHLFRLDLFLKRVYSSNIHSYNKLDETTGLI